MANKDAIITQYDSSLINVFANFHYLGVALIFVGAFFGVPISILLAPLVTLSVGLILIALYLNMAISFLKACADKKTSLADRYKKFGEIIHYALFVTFFAELVGGVFLLGLMNVR